MTARECQGQCWALVSTQVHASQHHSLPRSILQDSIKMLHLSLLLLLSLYFTHVTSQSTSQVSHRLTLEKKQHHHHGLGRRTRLGLSSPNDLFGYFANISIGADQVSVFIDTGSFRLVVNHAKYHPEKSPTSVNLHQQTSSLYAGNSGGEIDLYLDDVSIGDLKVNVEVGRFQQLAPGEEEPAPDILGLGPPFGPKKTDPSVTGAMSAQKLLSTGGFTLDLEAHGGTLVLNDPDIIDGFVYHRVNDTLSPDEWVIPTSGFGINRDLVLDSGTGLNYVSVADIHVFAKHFDLEIIEGDDISNQFQPIGDCNRDVGLTFEFSQGQKVPIPKHLFWRPMNDDKRPGICYSNFVAAGDHFAEGGIWIFGMAFLQAVKISHDVPGARVGLRVKV